MDFFTHQHKARTQTRFLAILFIVAVLLIIVCINLVFYFALASQFSEGLGIRAWLAQPYWIYISVAILSVIGITSLWRSWQLNQSADAVAKMVNATPVSMTTKLLQERQLINVVEEMSLAAGVPMPKVFIMKEESAINAFVSGLNSASICLVVTQGLLDNLNRQELQGVIAHEYSHVFHSDMKINVRLIGILAGILVIGQLGQLLLRTGRHTSSSRSSKSGGNAGAVLAIGIGLLAVGYIGLFFGRLIKAGISRQREFLADASAVQYTRDQDGISNALFKISQMQHGSLLNNPKAEEMSHMCFGQAIKQGFSGLLATHPPLEKRIQAVNPNFYRAQKSKLSAQQSAQQSAQPAASGQSAHMSEPNQSAALQGFAETNLSAAQTPTDHSTVTAEKGLTANHIIENIGAITPQQLSHAQSIIETIPDELIEIAKGETQADSPKELILGLLFVSKNDHTESQVKLLELPQHRQANVSQLHLQLASLSYKQQHILFAMALARIEQTEINERRSLVMQLSRSLNQDTQLSLTEFMVYACTARRVLPRSKNEKPIGSFRKIANEIDRVLTLLYIESTLSETERLQKLNEHRRLFGIANNQLTAAATTHQDLARALNKISQLHPLLKKDFIGVCVDIAENDGLVNQREYELLRLLGEYLECPFPITIA